MQSWVEGRTAGGVAYLRGWIGPTSDDASNAPSDDAPLLLLAHGTGFHAKTWEPTIAALSARTLAPTEAVAFDWSGHGLSRPLPGAGVSAERCDWAVITPGDVTELLQVSAQLVHVLWTLCRPASPQEALVDGSLGSRPGC